MKLNFTHISSYPAPARLGIFILILLLVWLPLAIPLKIFLRGDTNLASILTMGFLGIQFVLLLRFWNRKVYQNPQWLQPYGLRFTRKQGIDLLKGLSIGLLFILALFAVEGIFGWVKFKPSSVFLVRIILEGLLVSLGVAFLEELFFRGWILVELEKDYSAKIALVTNALLFAILHFLKPISEIIRTFPQFPGLIILGLTLVYAKRSHNQRLGISIGLHGGLVWGYYILKVGNLYQYTNNVSPLITGIDENPLAGVMGITFLSILGLGFWLKNKNNKEKLP